MRLSCPVHDGYISVFFGRGGVAEFIRFLFPPEIDKSPVNKPVVEDGIGDCVGRFKTPESLDPERSSVVN